MKITQLTHHDLDGYGASTVAGTRAAVSFIKHFVAANAKRAPERRHRLAVLDHHASSLDRLA